MIIEFHPSILSILCGFGLLFIGYTEESHIKILLNSFGLLAMAIGTAFHSIINDLTFFAFFGYVFYIIVFTPIGLWLQKKDKKRIFPSSDKEDNKPYGDVESG